MKGEQTPKTKGYRSYVHGWIGDDRLVMMKLMVKRKSSYDTAITTTPQQTNNGDGKMQIVS